MMGAAPIDGSSRRRRRLRAERSPRKALIVALVFVCAVAAFVSPASAVPGANPTKIWGVAIKSPADYASGMQAGRRLRARRINGLVLTPANLTKAELRRIGTSAKGSKLHVISIIRGGSRTAALKCGSGVAALLGIPASQTECAAQAKSVKSALSLAATLPPAALVAVRLARPQDLSRLAGARRTHARILAIVPLPAAPKRSSTGLDSSAASPFNAAWRNAIVLAAHTPSLDLVVSAAKSPRTRVDGYTALLASTLTSTASANVDLSPPTAPAVTVESVTQTSVTLKWLPSVDDSGSVSYTVFENRQSIGTGTSPYVMSNLACGTTYQLGVQAVDPSANASAITAVSATTANCSTGSGGGGGSPAPASPPSNTGVPTVSGTAQVGQTLSATTGSWSGTSPISFAYKWQDCNSSGASCTAIAGATSGSYLLASSDQGYTIRAVVTASNSTGSASASSAQTAVVQTTAPAPVAPSNTAAPTVSGTAQVGQTLSATTGSWSGTSPISFAYKWQDCNSSGASCTAIAGATSGSYLLASSDQGHTIRAVVTASNSTGSASASSAQTAVVQTTAPAPVAPSNTAAPTVSGTAQVGQTLSATTGSWSGTSPISFAYKWQDCNSSGASCTAIAGATSGSYLLASSDQGYTIRAVVTASNSTGSASASSAQTAVVQAAPAPVAPSNTAAPTVSGTAQVGQTLSATTGSWSGTTDQLRLQVQDCNSSGASCTAIAGATSGSVPVGLERPRGHTIRAVVTASNSTGGSASASSAQTAVVQTTAPAPVALLHHRRADGVGGTAQVGQTAVRDHRVVVGYGARSASPTSGRTATAPVPVALRSRAQPPARTCWPRATRDTRSARSSPPATAPAPPRPLPPPPARCRRRRRRAAGR